MTPEELIEAQQVLEAESRAIGQARYRNKRNAPWIDALGPLADEASLPPGRAMVLRVLKPTAEAIGALLEVAKAGRAGRHSLAFNLLNHAQATAEPLAYLTLRCALQAAVNEDRAQKVTLTVARAVMDHLQSEAFTRSNPAGAAGLQRSLAGRELISAKRQRAITAIHDHEGVALGWSQREQAMVGIKLIELAIEATGLFELHLVQTRIGKQIKRERILRATEAALSWLDRQHERCELLDPLPLPMVVPPRPWTSPTDGGYLNPPIGTKLVGAPSEAYREELKGAQMDLVYRAVNAIQATGWRINRRVLDVVERISTDGGGLAGLPLREAEPLPERPEGADGDPELLARWKAIRAEIHARNATSRSKRLGVAQQLWVARKLADFRTIYFPHDLDWRGRVYPIPQGGPHPQAGDLGRSLLEFATGKPVGAGGARWLAVHVANAFGVDKVSFDERVAWVEHHRAELIDSARDPLDGARFWATADKPWAALAASFEWAGYLDEGASFVSHLPIAIDGSNSGLQHLTALLRDSHAAPHVNLTRTERPGDIYALVAAKAQALVDASADPEANPWKNGKVTRGIAKQPCMTYVYSATARGMVEQIQVELARLDDVAFTKGQPPYLAGVDNFAAARWLGMHLYRLIGETVPAARTAMEWLKSASKAISSLDFPLWWTTPAGLPVMQRYPNMKGETLEATFRGKRLQLKLQADSLPRTFADWLATPSRRAMDGRQALNGIVPNFVHSLDAAHLMLTVVAAEDAGITALAVIHDSFGTYAADTDRLSRFLRETFVAMYDADPLAQFRVELVEQLEPQDGVIAKLPPLPARGEFDLRSILDAQYMFA
jgi:DNA-directed RNA polymerase